MSRLKPIDRKEMILAAALDEAQERGYQHITREGVAKRAVCSPGLVSTYFNTMTQLRRAVVRAAVSREVLPIIAQGLVAKDPQALKIPSGLKQAALAAIHA